MRLNKRLRWMVSFCASGCWILLCSPGSVAAQDVVTQAQDRNVRPPAWVMETLRNDPNAFQFENGWKDKARDVRRARELLELQMGPSFSGPSGPDLGPTLTGTYRIPVLLALYSDLTAPHTSAAIDERLFGGGSGTVSLTELYSEMSRGVFTIDGTVPDWLTLPNTRAYYETDTDPDDKNGELWDFLSGSLDLADPLIDFGQFDNDGPDGVPNSGDDDGIVDTASFLYATIPMSCGGGATGIWPHSWSIRSARYLHGDGVLDYYYTTDAAEGGGFIRVNDYIVQSAVQCDGTSLMGSGTIAHEMGHALDLPDLYDTNDSDTDSSRGIGVWGLMGSGNWNRQTSPAHMSAWSKDQLGWLTVSSITTTSSGLTLPSIQGSGGVLRVGLPGTEEFFLLSNRQAVGSDQYLRGPGLLIWHIDPAVTALGYNINIDPSHKGVDLEEADGQDDLDAEVNSGDGGDPYPGSSSATSFTTIDYPPSDAYAGSYCTVGIRNIQESGNNIVLDIEPSERYVIWGDIDGLRDLTYDDLVHTYVTSLGFSPDETEGFEGNGDLDGDGDVDLRDGLMFETELRGIATVPESRYGETAFLPCVPLDPSTTQAGSMPVGIRLVPIGR